MRETATIPWQHWRQKYHKPQHNLRVRELKRLPGKGANQRLWLPVVPQAGAWRAPQTQSYHWGRRTRSVAAPEAAAVWSEPPEGNPGCFSDIARRPRRDTSVALAAV